ncbi:hypothetical protein [Azospirillum melinis]
METDRECAGPALLHHRRDARATVIKDSWRRLCGRPLTPIS